jgi:hypothetical protein
MMTEKKLTEIISLHEHWGAGHRGRMTQISDE